MKQTKHTTRRTFSRFMTIREPILAAHFLRDLRMLDQASCKSSRLPTSRAMLRRRRNLIQISWQRLSNRQRSASCGARVGGKGCWALPLANSPKFMALDSASAGDFGTWSLIQTL